LDVKKIFFCLKNEKGLKKKKKKKNGNF